MYHTVLPDSKGFNHAQHAGAEKVLVSIERMADNRALVFDTPNETKWSDVVEIRSALDVRQHIAYTIKVKLYRSNGAQLGRTIRVKYNNIISDLPMFILFRALGVTSDREIVRLVVYDMEDTEMIEMLKPSLEEGLMATDQEAALQYIQRELNINNNTQASEEAQMAYRLRLARDWTLKYFLPHVGEDMNAKALFLGHMINKLLQSVLGRRSYDDRDHFANKRLSSPGALISFLFSQNFSKSFSSYPLSHLYCRRDCFLSLPALEFGDLRINVNSIEAISS